jgi:hypothetical protein
MSTKHGEHKHIWLLATLVASQVGQPLIAHENVAARVVSAALIFAVLGAVFWKLLAPGRERWIGVALVGPAVVLELAHYGVPDESRRWLGVVLHLSISAFFVYALIVILGHVLRKKVLSIDDVVGAFSGYLMTGIVFGHLFTLVWLLVPDAFHIDAHIVWQLAEWHTRRALFSYFSFATLTSVGYGDIVTTAPVSNTLVWLEVMCGQFYLAVVVATIVGTRMARTLEPEQNTRV